MELEKRVAHLENELRKIGAQHDALWQIVKVMLPTIPMEPGERQALLTLSYDDLTQRMTVFELDADYQTEVMEHHDDLAAEILDAKPGPTRRPAPGRDT